MVWDADAPNAGFSDGKPWLPVKAPQAGHAVNLQEADPDSILHFYRKAIAFRKDNAALREGKTRFITLPEPLLAFTRTAEGQSLTCVFNLSTDAHTLTLSQPATLSGPRHANLDGQTLSLPGNGFAYLSHDGELDLSA